MKKKLGFLASLFSFVLITLSVSPLLAQPAARTISYQGVLTSNGSPVPDGDKFVTITLYDQSGNAVWIETDTVRTVKGVFSTQLGRIVPLPDPFPPAGELEVKISGTVLSPRMSLGSVPYALRMSGDFVGAVRAGGKVIHGTGDTVSLVAGSNVLLTSDASNNSITIAAGGNPSTVTGVQPGKYLTGGGVTGIVTLDLAIPLSIHETEASDLLTVANDGNGTAITGSAHGGGRAGFFEIVPAGNLNAAISATTGGQGPAASLIVNNPDNQANAFEVKTKGTGAAGFFDFAKADAQTIVFTVNNAGMGTTGKFYCNNSDNINPSIWGETKGTGAAVYGFNAGKGPAGQFENYAGATSPTVLITSNGEPGNALISKKTGDAGSAGYFWNSKPTNSTAALFALTAGAGAAVSGNGGPQGTAGLFLIDTVANSKDAVTATTIGTGNGGHFKIDNTSSSSDALFAETNGSGTAVLAISTHANGIAVKGIDDKPNSYGVFGTTANGIAGVYGYNASANDGMFGESLLASGVHGHSPKQDGVFGKSEGPAYAGVEGTNDLASGYGVYGGSSAGTGVCGSSTTGTAVFSAGSFTQAGGVFSATPTTTHWTTNKPATVKLHNGTEVKLFAEESAEIYFSDYGSGALSNGRAHIELDPAYLQTVTIDAAHPMKVFIQLEGDCNGIFVMNKAETGFDVVELQSGRSNAPFSYRIVCKRKYYEDERLATELQDIQYNTTMISKVWPEKLRELEAVRQQHTVRDR